jgi:hypothetical protein
MRWAAGMCNPGRRGTEEPPVVRLRTSHLLRNRKCHRPPSCELPPISKSDFKDAAPRPMSPPSPLLSGRKLSAKLFNPLTEPPSKPPAADGLDPFSPLTLDPSSTCDDRSSSSNASNTGQWPKRTSAGCSTSRRGRRKPKKLHPPAHSSIGMRWPRHTTINTNHPPRTASSTSAACRMPHVTCEKLEKKGLT